jgi:hypothetical protein
MSERKDDLKHDSLLREIDEDLRREKYEKLWKRYGSYLIAAGVLLVVAVAGFKLWKYQDDLSRTEASRKLTAAMELQETDKSAADEKLQRLIEDAPAGYAMLAGFRRAALLAQDGDRQAARALYQDLQRTASPPPYRDLAVILDAMTALEVEALPLDADAIRDRLQPLVVDANPWRFSARELTAIIEWRSGQTGEARGRLSALAADAQAPADVRGRAQQLLAQLGEG